MAGWRRPSRLLMAAISGDEVHPDREQACIARALIVAFLAIRAVHLVQGYLDLAAGWHAYRLPVTVAVLALAGTVSSLWVVARSWRRGQLDPLAVAVDVTFGMIALALTGVALRTGDRTTSLNWMLPYTVGTAVAAGLAMIRISTALLLSTGLALVYLGSVWADIAKGGGPLATAVVNAVSYVGFFCVAAVLRAIMFFLVGLLTQARSQAVARGEQLAAERERARQYRLVHDSALQTLEAVAKGWGGGDTQLRQRALRESQRLRLALRDNRAGSGEAEGPASLRFRLGLLVAEFATLGLNVEYVDAELDITASKAVTCALCEATREALTNVAKHAAVSAAVVRVATADKGIELSVLDHGQGFDESQLSGGFGITNCIRRRIAEVGGQAEIRSAPGEGTLVRLWSPA
jgi:signal transduction histidine kinase